MELIGIFFVASGLLVLAGVAKAIRPDDTARALSLLTNSKGRRGPSVALIRQAVRIGAALEVCLGVVAILFPGPPTGVLVAVSYALFLCVTVSARRSGGPLSTCGCFGRPDTPATLLHIVLNALFVTTAAVVALHSPASTWFGSLLEHQPGDGLPLLFASVIGVWLAYLALSPLAALEGTRRLVAMTHGSARA